MSERVAPTQWIWHGMAGHFCCSDKCCFRLHTVVGAYRISTVGCYHPAGDESGKPHTIGCDQLYETMVFHVEDEGPSNEIDSEGYNTEEDARGGHMRMCEKWSWLISRVSTPETPRTWTFGIRNEGFTQRFVLLDGPEWDGDRVLVEKAPVDVERERLLDLLERAYDTLGTAHLVETDWAPNGEEAERPDPRCRLCPVERDLQAVLREYGRLGKEEITTGDGDARRRQLEEGRDRMRERGVPARHVKELSEAIGMREYGHAQRLLDQLEQVLGANAREES
jgi:hypothetical protein